MDAEQFINTYKIAMNVRRIEQLPDQDMTDEWAKTANHWRCTFSRTDENGQRRKIVVYVSLAAVFKEAPDVYTVLEDVVCSIAGFEGTRLDNEIDFETWARDYGYDPDSRRDERFFRKYKKEARKWRRFLGDDLYRTLLDEIEWQFV